MNILSVLLHSKFKPKTQKRGILNSHQNVNRVKLKRDSLTMVENNYDNIKSIKTKTCKHEKHKTYTTMENPIEWKSRGGGSTSKKLVSSTWAVCAWRVNSFSGKSPIILPVERFLWAYFDRIHHFDGLFSLLSIWPANTENKIVV